MTFHEKLERAWRQTGSLLCIGVDPEQALSIEPVSVTTGRITRYLAKTLPHACAVKFQFAHFAANGMEASLLEAIHYVRREFHDRLIILDAKRSDIPSTAEHYAKEAFGRYQVDAVTLNPYLGLDSLQPYFRDPQNGGVIVCRSSNQGAEDFQDLCVGQEQKPLYLTIAGKVKNQPYHRQVILVMGASCSAAITNLRCHGIDAPLLIPGVGQQGGSLESVIHAGLQSDGTGLIISASRSIARHADPGSEACALNSKINDLRREFLASEKVGRPSSCQ